MDINYTPIERNRYFYGKLLSVRDLEAEQNYHSVKRRLLNRLVLGAGVVCGLGVTLSDDATLTIESGMALDYLGREIVIGESLIRKLEMLEGYETLHGKESAYLCAEYDEQETEPVNSINMEKEGQQHNRTREGYRLFVSPEPPEYQSLLKAEGKENISILYSSDELTLVLTAPQAVCAGDGFDINVLIVKNDKTLPVSFTLEWECGFIENENGRVAIEYAESPNEHRNVTEASFRFIARNLTDVSEQLFPFGLELNVELGSHKYKNFIQPEGSVYICASKERRTEYTRITDSLNRRLAGGGVPLYLAKLELISISNRIFLGTVTNLPFSQARRSAGESAEREGKLSVTTSVKTLEYWQHPDVKAVSDSAGGNIHLEFSLPKPENYDYRTCHGFVDVAMPGGIKVNAKYFSNEVPHGLGPGNVNVELSIEFRDAANGDMLLFGNSEVFRNKNSNIEPPWVETAVVVFPERGTMRIGIWAHDIIDGNSVRIHYFAEKPERDTRPMLDELRASISIIPEISRASKREKVRFKAEVSGSADKNVIWEVKDAYGGTINANGVYQAPEERGTYEIIAKASADPSVTASAFVIVE